MKNIIFFGIGSETMSIEGEIEGVGSFDLDSISASFTIQSEKENKILEIRVCSKPFWNFSIGPYKGNFERKPNWKNTVCLQKSPLLTQIFNIEVPDDSTIERVN